MLFSSIAAHSVVLDEYVLENMGSFSGWWEVWKVRRGGWRGGWWAGGGRRSCGGNGAWSWMLDSVMTAALGVTPSRSLHTASITTATAPSHATRCTSTATKSSGGLCL